MLDPRAKGRAGEREVRKILEERRIAHHWNDYVTQRYTPGATCDVVALGYAMEIKRYAHPPFKNAWWKQAQKSASRIGQLPAVVYRFDRMQWQICTELRTEAGRRIIAHADFEDWLAGSSEFQVGDTVVEIDSDDRRACLGSVEHNPLRTGVVVAVTDRCVGVDFGDDGVCATNAASISRLDRLQCENVTEAGGSCSREVEEGSNFCLYHTRLFAEWTERPTDALAHELGMVGLKPKTLDKSGVAA